MKLFLIPSIDGTVLTVGASYIYVYAITSKRFWYVTVVCTYMGVQRGARGGIFPLGF